MSLPAFFWCLISYQFSVLHCKVRTAEERKAPKWEKNPRRLGRKHVHRVYHLVSVAVQKRM